MRTITFLFTVFLFCGCKEIPKIELIKIQINSDIAVLSDPSLSTNNHSAIIYTNNYHIHEITSQHFSGAFNSTILDSTTYNYFIFRKNDTHGFLFKNIDDSIVMRLNVDTFVSNNGSHFKVNSEEIFKEKFVRSTQGKNKFLISYIVDKHTKDSVKLYFDDDLKDVQYSFSKTFDSLYNSKLYKIEMPVSEQYVGEPFNKKIVSQYILSFKKDWIPDTEKIYRLISRFETKDFKVDIPLKEKIILNNE